MSDFRKLKVWQQAHILALESHKVAIRIRGAHYVSLRSQMIRAAISVPANIVEGREQKSEKDFARFLKYSVGSSSELEYHLQLGLDLHVITQKDFDPLLAQLELVRRMLNGLIAKLDP